MWGRRADLRDDEPHQPQPPSLWVLPLKPDALSLGGAPEGRQAMRLACSRRVGLKLGSVERRAAPKTRGCPTQALP